jgi:NADH-quinone oxidoreductase subunit A
MSNPVIQPAATAITQSGTNAASSLLDWLPILLFLGIALILSFGFVVLPMIVSRLTGTHKPTPEKLTEYECGFPAFEDTRSQFDVRFYRVALLFIILDVEAAFLYPWAVSVFDLGWAAWIGMRLFLLILTAGFAYEWAMGALEWE